jgi:hypothetical protein
MHSPQSGRESSVGKPSHEARRRVSSRRGPEGLDEKNLQEAREDHIACRPQLA